MARRITFDVEVQGEEREGWVELSNTIDQAAYDYAMEERIEPLLALEEITGLNPDLLADEFFGDEDEAEDESGDEDEDDAEDD